MLYVGKSLEQQHSYASRTFLGFIIHLAKLICTQGNHNQCEILEEKIYYVYTTASSRLSRPQLMGSHKTRIDEKYQASTITQIFYHNTFLQYSDYFILKSLLIQGVPSQDIPTQDEFLYKTISEIFQFLLVIKFHTVF